MLSALRFGMKSSSKMLRRITSRSWQKLAERIESMPGLRLCMYCGDVGAILDCMQLSLLLCICSVP